MTAIIAHWELPAAFQTRQAAKKYFTRWTHTAKAFKCRALGFVQVERMPVYQEGEIDVYRFDMLEEAISRIGGTPVYVEEGGVCVSEFEFPESPTFIFGSDFGRLDRADVSIEAAIPLHAEIACGILLQEYTRVEEA